MNAWRHLTQVHACAHGLFQQTSFRDVLAVVHHALSVCRPMDLQGVTSPNRHGGGYWRQFLGHHLWTKVRGHRPRQGLALPLGPRIHGGRLNLPWPYGLNPLIPAAGRVCPLTASRLREKASKVTHIPVFANAAGTPRSGISASREGKRRGIPFTAPPPPPCVHGSLRGGASRPGGSASCCSHSACPKHPPRRRSEVPPAPDQRGPGRRERR